MTRSSQNDTSYVSEVLVRRHFIGFPSLASFRLRLPLLAVFVCKLSSILGQVSYLHQTLYLPSNIIQHLHHAWRTRSRGYGRHRPH